MSLLSDDRMWSAPGILAIAEDYKQIQTVNHHGAGGQFKLS